MSTADQDLHASIKIWDAKDQHIAFQEFREMAELSLAVKDIEREVTWKYLILLLRQDSMTRWKAFALMEAERRDHRQCGRSLLDPYRHTTFYLHYIKDIYSTFNQKRI